MEKEWHSRGYLPHWEAGETPQSITFRLADSLPSSLLKRCTEEIAHLPENEAALKYRIRIESALDAGHGEGTLINPTIAEIVENAFLHFDGERYWLHAWTIMPNHVHVLATPLHDHTLSSITKSWKSFSARRANEVLGRSGTFWAPEYYDRAIRDETHFDNVVAYIAMNPVKAGLRHEPGQWRFSSSWCGRKSGQNVRVPRA
jgi:REP element-mobilizing transposase RayT